MSFTIPMLDETDAHESEPALLILEDGTTLRGEAFGARGSAFGEAVFATGMTGYQETLTDPSYHRQVIVMTAPHIGNTGMNLEDPESDRIWAAGFVVRDLSPVASNWRAEDTLGRSLEAAGVVGVRGVDTRALTRHLRERGVMRVGLFSGDALTDAATMLEAVKSSPGMLGANLSAEVSTSAPYTVPAIGQSRFTVVAVDLGIKRMTPALMAQRGMTVHVVPSDHTYEQIRRSTRTACSSPTGPATLPPPTTRLRSPAARWATRCRRSESVSATRSSAVLSGSAPTNSPTVTGGSTSRCRTGPPARSRSPRTTTGSRSRPRSTRTWHRLRPGPGQPRVSQRRCRRGAAVPGCSGIQRPVPPGGGGRPA